ncbi:MAG: FTR1 family protein, partial [Cyanobacteria bacterium CAN_BIN43]|nr:FTR1 family protein [Cyanobacteria bacterium CAN_BIN43]
MDFSAALPTFVITLREGVEAALVVGIVLAYLKKANQTRLNSWVYAGIGVGL